jgi:hypothetical protein
MCNAASIIQVLPSLQWRVVNRFVLFVVSFSNKMPCGTQRKSAWVAGELAELGVAVRVNIDVGDIVELVK